MKLLVYIAVKLAHKFIVSLDFRSMKVANGLESRKRPHLKIWKKTKKSDVLDQNISELLSRRSDLSEVGCPLDYSRLFNLDSCFSSTYSDCFLYP